jgi:ketosteroid isomerase-like protein
MQTHPNAVFLSKLYAHFSEGNFEGMLAMLPENITFQVAGKSPLAGKFTKTNFVDGFAKKLASLSNHSYQFQAHDVLASDLHGTVLGTVKLTLQGKPLELRMVHVWRFEKGTPVAGYEYTRDLYAFDSAFLLANQ